MDKIPKWKRTTDIVGIIITLPITIPVAVGVMAYIKLISKGPVLFKQERVGHGFKKFTCYKFRTMKPGSDVNYHKNYIKTLMKSNKPMTKTDDKGDTRLINGARFIRSTGLDELPQLWNVLKGDMSIVGPRPCIPYEFDQFEEWHKERFNTLPGLTGLWQVSGKNKTTFQRMMELDVIYTKNLNLLSDLKIIAKTVPSIIDRVLD